MSAIEPTTPLGILILICADTGDMGCFNLCSRACADPHTENIAGRSS